MGGDSEHFTVEMEVHQRLALSPFLFVLVMDELMQSIQNEVLCYMLFVDGIILTDETHNGVNSRLRS